MAKTYVDMEQLEKLFSEYAIPYTNIFDELTPLTAEQIAEDMSAFDLGQLLDRKDVVFATQIWRKEDVKAVLRKIEDDFEYTRLVEDESLMGEIINEAKDQLEDCTNGLEMLRSVAETCVKRRMA